MPKLKDEKVKVTLCFWLDGWSIRKLAVPIYEGAFQSMTLYGTTRSFWYFQNGWQVIRNQVLSFKIFLLGWHKKGIIDVCGRLDVGYFYMLDREKSCRLLKYAQRQGNLLFFDCAIKGFLDSPKTISFYVCFMSERKFIPPWKSRGLSRRSRSAMTQSSPILHLLSFQEQGLPKAQCHARFPLIHF